MVMPTQAAVDNFATLPSQEILVFRPRSTLHADNALIFIASLFLALVYFNNPVFSPPEPTEVFTGCAADVGTNCQLCLSVIKDQILNRASMTCTCRQRLRLHACGDIA